MLFWGHIFSYFHFEGCGRESGLAMETQNYFLGGKMFWLTFVILSNDENNRKYSLLSKEDDKCKFNLFICRFMSFPSAKAVQKTSHFYSNLRKALRKRLLRRLSELQNPTLFHRLIVRDAKHYNRDKC